MAKEKKKSFWLGIDRIIARSILWQILIALLLSSALIGIVGLIYNRNQEPKPLGKAFADIVSPVTLRNEAYKDSTQVPVSDNTAAALNPHKEKNLLGLGVIYLCGSLVFSGLLIASITNALRTRADRFKEGKVRYRFRNHVVIIGYNNLVPGMIHRIWKENGGRPNRIVIGVNGNVQETFNQLRNHLEENKKMVVVLNADSKNRWDLRKRLKVQYAKEVYIIGDGDDAYLMNSYKKIQEICGEKMPECYVEMRHQSTFALFQTYSATKGYEHFHAFNFHDIWARQMVMREEIDTRQGMSIGPDSDKQVHLVVIGMTEMGEALAREAAFICHYPNYVTRRIRTKITFIDPQAKEQMTYLTGRYRHLFDLCHYSFFDYAPGALNPAPHNPEKDFLDIEFEFIQANIAERQIREKITEWASSDKQVLTIGVCTDMPHRSMAAGLYLPDEVFENNIPVWVYQPAKGDLKDYLECSHFKNIITFGMSGKDLDIKNEDMILQAKRLNYLYGLIYDTIQQNKEKSQEEILDAVDSLVLDYKKMDEKGWNNLDVFKKWSNVYCVSTIKKKIDSVRSEWSEKNIQLIDAVEHNRWNVEKLMMGFRPATDEERRTEDKDGLKQRFIHCDIRPYNDLDEETKKYDNKFTKEIPNIIKPI